MGVRRWAAKIDMPVISEAMAPTVQEWYVDAEIEIVKPDINGGDFDRATNTKVRTPVTIWTGAARIQEARWPSVSTAKQGALSLREIIFHMAKDPANPWPEFIQQGWRINVLSAPLGKQFETGLFVIVTAVNSSYDWDLRIETTMDQGAQIGS